MRIKFKNKHFLPLGMKPNVLIHDNVYKTHEIVIFNDNFCLISKELKVVIEPIDIDILFDYDYKTLPNQTIYFEEFLSLRYKINDKIYNGEDIVDKYNEYLPHIIIDEESLFYLKLNNDLLEIVN